MVKVIFLCLKNDSTIQEDNERLGLSAAARHVIATMRFPPSLLHPLPSLLVFLLSFYFFFLSSYLTFPPLSVVSIFLYVDTDHFRFPSAGI